jgi:hypothetical protein
MEHKDKIKSLTFIRPNAEFILRDNKLEWLDETQIEPTQSELESGLIAYQAAETAEAETKATAKAALLERLGISEDEARLLLS